MNLNKKYTVNIKFSDGTCHFSNVSEADSKNFDTWMSGKSENSIMDYIYKDDIYYLNREFFCYGAIKEDQENFFEKKKNKIFK